MKCECCGGATFEPTKYQDVYGTGANLMRCSMCGVKTYDKVVMPAEEFYVSDDARKHAEINSGPDAGRDAIYPGLCKQLMDAAKPSISAGHGRLYEVGCNGGDFLRHAMAAGFEVADGCDANPRAVEIAVAQGFDVEKAFFTKAQRMPNRPYDAVAMLDVIEHTHTPRADLQKVAGILRLGGSLLIKTFYDEFHHDMSLDLSKGRWFTRDIQSCGYFCPISHPFHFDVPVLRLLVERTRFAIVSTSLDATWGQVTLLARLVR